MFERRYSVASSRPNSAAISNGLPRQGPTTIRKWASGRAKPSLYQAWLEDLRASTSERGAKRCRFAAPEEDSTGDASAAAPAEEAGSHLVNGARSPRRPYRLLVQATERDAKIDHEGSPPEDGSAGDCRRRNTYPHRHTGQFGVAARLLSSESTAELEHVLRSVPSAERPFVKRYGPRAGTAWVPED